MACTALLAWVLLGAVAWLATRPFFRPPPSFRRLLRCLGFAQAPTMLLALLAAASDPRVYLVAYFAVMGWAFAAVAVALRAATDTSSGRAALLAVPVFLAQFVLLLLSRYLLLG
ncbi:MAG: YIP1 family protein [Candidatus Binatia bacterium]